MMKPNLSWIAAAVLFWGITGSAAAATEPESGEGTIFTLWPLIDYRESPGEGFSNLAILGPLIKVQRQRDEQTTALRPLFYRTAHERDETASTDYLYPFASTDSSPETTRFQFLHLVQKNSFRKDEGEGEERDSMFFPFYISGTSKKYGPYTSVFPIYGDIYERFWRDEYHYVLFPLYGKTVKKGTISRNYLYPIFNTLEGERESGFHVWPLYGQSAKEGVYRKRFVLWPFYLSESRGLDTDNPTEKILLFPLYAATDSPQKTARTYLWPFIGYSEDRAKKETERDYFWPFIWTARGENRRVDSYLPFYSHEQKPGSSKSWYLWPLYRHDTLQSDTFVRDRDRILFFLYSDNTESWPKDGTDRRRVALWPLFVYNRDAGGVKSFGLPALMEPILDREGIERNWAPLWRIYSQRWADNGDSAVSFLWNLYWHEARGDSLMYELYPLLRYRSTPREVDMHLLKGLFRYRSGKEGRSVRLFWLPFGISWGAAHASTPAALPVDQGTQP